VCLYQKLVNNKFTPASKINARLPSESLLVASTLLISDPASSIKALPVSKTSVGSSLPGYFSSNKDEVIASAYCSKVGSICSAGKYCPLRVLFDGKPPPISIYSSIVPFC